jgi:D-3-phosphoglycerate dehydrogenase
MAANSKKVAVPNTMCKAGIAILKARPEITVVEFDNFVSSADFQRLLAAQDGVHAAILGATPWSRPECEASRTLQVVARIGVGFDAVDVPELTRRKIPLMVVGTANSPSVAEQAMFMMLMLAKRGAELDQVVRGSRWKERMAYLPFDLVGKTCLVIGFGRIGTRTAKRAAAMEMHVAVYDPYVKPEAIKAAGCEPVTDLDQALPRADFVSIHCPKNKETTGMFDARRLARLKPTAYLVNTARGGLIDEAALHSALTTGKLAGAGLDVFESEPVKPDNPLLKLPNVITAPHMAGVTLESVDRMGQQAARNVLSVFDGAIIRDNVVNQEILK